LLSIRSSQRLDVLPRGDKKAVEQVGLLVVRPGEVVALTQLPRVGEVGLGVEAHVGTVGHVAPRLAGGELPLAK
jgi:hypothetical protein